MTCGLPTFRYDPVSGHLLSPENTAVLIIDFQPTLIRSVITTDRRSLLDNITAVARTAKLFQLPVIVSTVRRDDFDLGPTIRQITDVLPDARQVVRTSFNAWEDEQFVDAVAAVGRRKLIAAALWTETALTFAVLSAIQEGYEAFPVVDAVGGTSQIAHQAALDRMSEAGAISTTWVQLLCELQRDWGRAHTYREFSRILSVVCGE